MPAINKIAASVASTIGSDKFGILRVPTEHRPHAPPLDLLDKFWSPVGNFMVLNVQAPLQWPLVLRLAAQKASPSFD